MNTIRTLAGMLALAFTAAAETQTLNFLIEPGAFHPGNFSLPAPGKDHAAALRAKATNMQNAVRMGLSTQAERMEAEQAALYAEMRCSPESARPAELRKLVSKSEELQQLRAQQAKNGLIAATIRHEADIKAAYYTAALQQDSASADSLLQAADARDGETLSERPVFPGRSATGGNHAAGSPPSAQRRTERRGHAEKIRGTCRVALFPRSQRSSARSTGRTGRRGRPHLREASGRTPQIIICGRHTIFPLVTPASIC